jgi:hypothetical protein
MGKVLSFATVAFSEQYLPFYYAHNAHSILTPYNMYIHFHFANKHTSKKVYKIPWHDAVEMVKSNVL